MTPNQPLERNGPAERSPSFRAWSVPGRPFIVGPLCRMRYAALSVLAAVSAPLLVATCVLWVRSHSMTDDVFWYGDYRDGVSRMTRYRTSGGGFHFETRTWGFQSKRHREWNQYRDKAVYPFAASPDSPLHERLGFMASTKGYDLLLVAPYWSVALVTAPFPLLWVRASHRRLRRRWRHRRGLCAQCGYDLRASPAACPECGHPAAA